MPAVYVSRISQWIEKHFNAKGGNVITDVDPTAVVQLPFLIGVEDRYLQGWNRFIGSFSVSGVAAQFSRALIRNPTGSNMIAVIESFFPSGGASQVDYTIENNQPDLANVQAAGTLLRRLDARSGFSDSVCILSSDTNATQFPGAANIVMRRSTTVEVILHPDQEITLLPKDGLWMVTDVVNIGMTVNLVWRERALELSELT